MAKRKGPRIDKSLLAIPVVKYGSVDKSVLEISEPERIVDHEYRQSYRDRTCEASDNGIDLCGKPCIGAHIRAGEYSGGGQKPCDRLTIGLCDDHHRDQEANPGLEWWAKYVWKPSLRRRYREWKNGK